MQYTFVYFHPMRHESIQGVVPLDVFSQIFPSFILTNKKITQQCQRFSKRQQKHFSIRTTQPKLRMYVQLMERVFPLTSEEPYNEYMEHHVDPHCDNILSVLQELHFALLIHSRNEFVGHKIFWKQKRNSRFQHFYQDLRR